MTLLESIQARFYTQADIFPNKKMITECRHCGSENIEDLSNMLHEYDMICNDCGFRWEE